MSDKKPSVRDILDEYSSENNMRKSGVTAPPKPVSHERTIWDNESVNVNEQQKKNTDHKITVLNGAVDADGNPKPAVYNSPVINTHMNTDDISKIRRMTESTRAREASELQKSKKNHHKKEIDYTYKKETPDGEYMYTPPALKKKKRSRAVVLAEAEDPENLRLITDIVPRPAIIEASKYPSKKPVHTRQRLQPSLQNDDFQSDEAVDSSTKKRTKDLADSNKYGNVEDVGKNIRELKSIIKTRMTILFMLSFFSLFITFMNQIDLPILDFLNKNNTISYLSVHLITGIIAVISSLPVISKGIKNLFTLKADSDSMTSVTIITCILSLLPAFIYSDSFTAERIYMPVGILALLSNSVGKYLILQRAERNFKTVSDKDFKGHGIVYVRNEERAERLTRGTLGDFPILASMRETDYFTDFLKYTYSSDITDKYCRKATPVCLIVSALFSVVMTLFCKESPFSAEAVYFGMSIFCMLMCATSCIAMPLVANCPLERISKRAIIKKGVIFGYQSIDDFYDTNSILVNTDSLFPAHSVKLCGVKLFFNKDANEALLEAASLTSHAGSVMRHLFDDIIDENRMLYNIENFSYEESMGLCGWIQNKRVLFGTRELMHSHNIEGLPTKTKEAEYIGEGQEAMYLSVSGNIAALFTVKISADREVRRWVRQLSRNKIFMIMKNIDPCLSPEKISTLFGVSRSMFRIIPKKLHEDFNRETKKTKRLSASLACSGKFSAFAQLIIGTKVIHSASILGLIFQTVSIVLGFIFGMVLIISKAFQFDYIYMSSAAIIVYNLACTALTYLALCSKKF